MTGIRDLFFIDDCALNSRNELEMQLEVDRFSSACDSFGFAISTWKTEVQIKVNGQTPHAVENLTYLGNTLSRNTNIDAEINCRISKASSAFGRLREKVW